MVALCLAGEFGKVLCVLGVVCSSWSIVNIATSQRDELTPYGNCFLPSVRAGNKMVARWGYIVLLKFHPKLLALSQANILFRLFVYMIN